MIKSLKVGQIWEDSDGDWYEITGVKDRYYSCKWIKNCSEYCELTGQEYHKCGIDNFDWTDRLVNDRENNIRKLLKKIDKCEL